MGGGTNLIQLICLFGGIPILIPSLFVLLRWRLAPRRGDTPYCRKCRYNLTGIDGATAESAPAPAAIARCPECGTELTARNVLRGERLRRRWVLIAGLLGTLIGGSAIGYVAAGYVAKIDWYALQPTSWIIADLETGAPASMTRALPILRDRVEARSIWKSDINRLADACLKLRPTLSPWAGTNDLPNCVHILEKLRTDNQLNEPRTKRYFEEMVSISFRVREKLARDERAKFFARFGLRADAGLWAYVSTGDSQIDGATLAYPAGPAFAIPLGSSMGGFDVSSVSHFSTETPALGVREVSHTIRVRIYAGNDGRQFVSDGASRGTQFPIGPPDTRDPLIYTFTREHVAKFERLDQSVEDVVQLHTSPALDAAVRGAVQLYYVDVLPPELNATAERKRVTFQLMLMRSPPIALAFAGSSDEALPTTGSAFPTLVRLAATSVFATLTLEFPKNAESATLRLQPSREAATDSVDMYEIWGGELVFENVPIKTSGSVRIRPKLVETLPPTSKPAETNSP